jgi:hypothetical protein
MLLLWSEQGVEEWATMSLNKAVVLGTFADRLLLAGHGGEEKMRSSVVCCAVKLLPAGRGGKERPSITASYVWHGWWFVLTMEVKDDDVSFSLAFTGDLPRPPSCLRSMVSIGNLSHFAPRQQ